MWTCEIPILLFGTEEQKLKYLPKLCRGELIGGNAMTEPGAGSDAYSLVTTADRQGDRYILNGSKLYVTNGTVADLLVTYATVDKDKGKSGITGFLVERSSPGLRISSPMQKMGLRTSPMAEISFQDCEVPASNILGREGAGVAMFTHSMEWERSSILASSIGAMERQLEACVRFARQRKQFGKNIGKFQMVADKMVDMKLRIETARLLLYKTAWMRKNGCFALMESAMTKLYTSEAWVASCMDAIQIHGGYGFVKEYHVERLLRDAKITQIYEGTSEVQRIVISRTVLKG